MPAPRARGVRLPEDGDASATSASKISTRAPRCRQLFQNAPLFGRVNATPGIKH